MPSSFGLFRRVDDTTWVSDTVNGSHTGVERYGVIEMVPVIQPDPTYRPVSR